jgi:hypothetical protein
MGEGDHLSGYADVVSMGRVLHATIGGRGFVVRAP